MMSENTKFLSVAIDFGTTYSGYAFSFSSDKKKIHTFMWEWDGFQSEKAPTNILFDENKQFMSFGFQAEDDFVKKEALGEADEVYFFKLFKMKLYKTKGLNRLTKLKDYSNKKEMLAVDVFSAGIKFLKNHFFNFARQKRVDFEDGDIQWVLTVPAIWDDAAKQFMREAANKAGIQNDQLFLALEPEAASVYYLLNQDKIGIPEAKLERGDRYMVIDNGGGTVDVTVHEVLDNCEVKEIYKASGGDWGGRNVDDAFQEWLLDVFEFECVEGLPLSDKLKLVGAFQKTKRNSTNIPAFVSIWVPTELLSMASTVVGTEYEGKVRFIGDRIRISDDIYKSFFQKTIRKIVEHAASILERNVSSVGVSLILMVGGFSNSSLLQAEMKDRFPCKKVFTPDDASTAVLKGAVEMGHNKSLVSGRISSFTYGVSTNRRFISGYHKPEYMFLVEGKLRCRHLYHKFVTAGENVKIGEKTDSHPFSPLYSDQRTISFNVYRSSDINPTYTTEPGCVKIGKLTIPLSGYCRENRSVEAHMEFGSIELTLKVKEELTGEVREGIFDFLSHS